MTFFGVNEWEMTFTLVDDVTTDENSFVFVIDENFW